MNEIKRKQCREKREWVWKKEKREKRGKMRKEERNKVRKRKKVRTTRQEMECFVNLRQC